MTAITVSFSNKDSNRIAVGKPVTTGLWHDIWDNTQYLKEWLGASFLAGAIQDHDHDGVNSKSITLRLPFWRDFGDGSDGSVTHSSNTSIAPGVYNYINFTLNSGITLTQNNRGPLVIRCTGTCTINGTITANGMGGRGGYGAAPPYVNPDSAYQNVEGTYGIYPYHNLLSGGSGGANNSGYRGGSSILTLGGSGTSAGSTPAARARLMALAMNEAIWGGAGGRQEDASGVAGDGGGSILIIANAIAFNSGAILNANGNTGASACGGGGGGVIVFAYKTLSADAGTKNVSAGAGGAAAYAGGAGWTQNIQV